MSGRPKTVLAAGEGERARAVLRMALPTRKCSLSVRRVAGGGWVLFAWLPVPPDAGYLERVMGASPGELDSGEAAPPCLHTGAVPPDPPFGDCRAAEALACA